MKPDLSRHDRESEPGVQRPSPEVCLKTDFRWERWQHHAQIFVTRQHFLDMLVTGGNNEPDRCAVLRPRFVTGIERFVLLARTVPI